MKVKSKKIEGKKYSVHLSESEMEDFVSLLNHSVYGIESAINIYGEKGEYIRLENMVSILRNQLVKERFGE